MNKKLFLACLGLALCAGAGYAPSVLAQAKPEVLVKQRQAAMTLQGKYFGPLAAMASGKAPYDAAIAARNAAFLDALIKMPWDGFQASTKDEKSRALPAIYDDAAKFKEAQERAQTAVSHLVAAKDEGSFKAAVGDVNKSCGGCHESFRAK
jgi:cytochrome c556